jgi:hypothetical protein
MAWTLKKDTKSLAESGFQQLPVGTNTFEITACGLVAVKDDPSGRAQQVSVTFTKNGVNNTQTYNTDHANDNIARMNGEVVRSLFDACDVAKFDASGLKKCIGKFVEVRVEQSEKNGKTYTNIKSIEAADGEEEEEEEEQEEEAPKPSKKAKAPEPEADEEEEDEEEEEEKPAGKKARPWG